ncbi:MAG: InlB B-repeat-containing protein [Oscillospiraceae bacterium]|nr:InlB B-repeat-containing protein [Oscillospiraceae bacterium]
MKKRKLTLWLLILSLLFACLPLSALAEEEAPEVVAEEVTETVPEEAPTAEEESSEEEFPAPGVFVNPLYAAEVSPEWTERPQRKLMAAAPARSTLAESGGEETVYTDVAAAANALRPHMAAHEPQLAFSYWIQKGSEMTDTAKAIMNDIIYTHTLRGNEGDAIRRTYSKYKVDWVYNKENGGYRFDITVSVEYYSSYAQERELDAKAAELLASLALEGKSDYEKLRAIYDCITRSVTYDYSDTVLKYTGYGALCQGKAACQGIAVAMYRLCLDAGIDCRIIGAQPVKHAWTIASVDGVYYLCDPTWDLGGRRSYFLRGGEYWLKFHNSRFELVYDRLGDNWDEPGFAERYSVPVWDCAPPGTANYPLVLSSTEDTENEYLSFYNNGADLPLQEPRRTGYLFCGWYEDAWGGGERVDVIPAHSVGPKQLYARWEAAPCTVIFSDGSGEEERELMRLESRYDSAFRMPPCSSTRDGFVFAGWNTAPDGSGETYLPGESVMNLTADGELELYARWLTAESGSCGNGVSWTLREDGVLCLEGQGAMEDYDEGGAPWSAHAGEIRTVIVSAGVESLGQNAFSGCALPLTLCYEGSEEDWAQLPGSGEALPAGAELSFDHCRNGRHSWGEPVYHWSEDLSACMAERVCLRDEGHRESSAGAVTRSVTLLPTERTEGTETFTARFFADWAPEQRQERTIPWLHVAGDMNSSGTVEESDVRDLARYVLALGAQSDIYEKFTDVNGDGVTDAADVVLLSAYTAAGGEGIDIR